MAAIERKAWIYGIVDPVTDSIVYVGQTTNTRVRFWNHCRAKARSRVTGFVRALRAISLKPKFIIIEECTVATVNELEVFWIASLKRIGASLLNLTDGGGGCSGRKQSREEIEKRTCKLRGRKASDATRAKNSLATKAQFENPEMRKRLSAVTKARFALPEWRKKMSAWHKGKTMSKESRAKISAKLKGRTISDETRAKLSAAAFARYAPKNASVICG